MNVRIKRTGKVHSVVTYNSASGTLLTACNLGFLESEVIKNTDTVTCKSCLKRIGESGERRLGLTSLELALTIPEFTTY